MRTIKIKNDLQELTILTTGATIHEWKCFSDYRNILISNNDKKVYQMTNMGYLSQTIGRVANRIDCGQFLLNDKMYQLSKNFAGNHHGHGGPTGFFMREFEIVEQSSDAVKMKYVSKHLEEGYPGTVTLLVTYELKEDRFKITYEATTTEDTIINITNHAHFNLSDEDTILNHEVKVTADKILDIDEHLIPSGKYINVAHTPFDLTSFKKLSDVILHEDVQKITLGLDHAYVFDQQKQVHLRYMNKNLIINTTYPGVQIYSMNYPLTQKLLNGRVYHKHMGIAFEPQYEPNGINIPHFNQPILRAEETYKHSITYHIFEA